ncbi:MAG: VWA domain-containing protein [Pseudomonadota bacterium]
MISFDAAWILLFLPLPWIVWRYTRPHRETVSAFRVPFFRRIAQVTNQEPRAGSVILKRGRLQVGSALVVWVCLVAALAGPERVGEPIEITKAARDMVLAIDISGSMDEVDFKTPEGEQIQRFSAVQGVVAEFVAAREDDRVALIVFGSQPYLQAPLTQDLDTINELLAQTDVGMAGPHTALGDAIGLSIRTFEASEIEERVLILLSDGSDTASIMSPINAAEIARQEGVQIYTIAVGDPEGDGENKVDVATLGEIARRSGGETFFANDVDALTVVYERIDALNPREVETLSHRPRRSLAFVPMAVAALVGLVTLLILQLRSRRNEEVA